MAASRDHGCVSGGLESRGARSSLSSIRKERTIPPWIDRSGKRLVFAPLWGFVTLSTPGALALGPVIVFGAAVASFCKFGTSLRIGSVGVAVIYLIFWSVDATDRRHHPDVVDQSNVMVADALPDAWGYQPRRLPVDEITGVLVRAVDRHCAVAVCVGSVGDEIEHAGVFELDGTRRLATRRGKRTAAIVAATIARTINRPLLGYYS
jgi:hypothetical protein